MNNYASLCDDFGVSTYVHGKLEMPTNRETVLHFFEAVQKAFPKMTEFEKRADGEYMLEEDREAGSYRWCSLDARRLWVTASANHAPCSIPSERVLKEGGSEGGDAMIYYDRPTRFATGVEQKIIDEVHRQLPEPF